MLISMDFILCGKFYRLFYYNLFKTAVLRVVVVQHFQITILYMY